MKKLLCFLCLFILLTPLTVAEQELPTWEYPIEPVILKDASGFLVLTNKSSLLDSSFAPDDLVNVTLKREGSCQLRKPIHDALSDMFAAAKEAGYTLYVKSAYRSYQTQNTMYYNRKERLGYDDGLVAYPGSSDHQTGMGIDVLNYEWMQKDGMNYRFAEEKEAQWMAEHCHEYGFVIRYLKDKEDVTGIDYEPWHLRYVGIEAATYMMENYLTLEEFTLEWQSYVADFESAYGLSLDEYCKMLSALPEPVETGEYGEDGDAEISLFYTSTN